MSAETINAIANLLWPLLAIAGLVVLFPSLRRVISSRDFTVEMGDKKITVQDASEQLRSAVADLQRQVADLRTERAVPAPAKVSDESGPSAPNTDREILWVDDNPTNNAMFAENLRELGARVLQATSRSDALGLAKSRLNRPYDLIISDMGRSEGGHFERAAGLRLLRDLRQIGVTTPLVFFTSSTNAEAHRDEAVRLGAAGITSSPVALLAIIRTVLAAQTDRNATPYAVSNS